MSGSSLNINNIGEYTLLIFSIALKSTSVL